jgi:hypothetical protein
MSPEYEQDTGFWFSISQSPSSVAIQAALATEAAMSQEPDCGRRRQFHEGSQRSPHGTVRYSLSMQSFQAPSEARCKRLTAMQRN